MFIDGLDEIDGDYHGVLALISNLIGQENVKICLSSRPLLVFEEAFSVAPSLKLQDLTYHSIRAYADTQLSHLIQRQVDRRDSLRVQNLVDGIVDRASGVFLWAVIAIRDIRDGLRDIVNLDELTQTINDLPSQLEGLFMLMLNRIKPAYQRDAARFLQIALYFPLAAVRGATFTLCILYFIHCQRSSEDAPHVYDKVATREIVEACKILRTRLLSHTAGLLDLTSSNDGACRLHDTDEPLLHTRITFLHRTARDFVQKNDHAKSFLARKGFTKAEVHILIARGLLSHLAQFSEQTAFGVSRYEPVYSYMNFKAVLQHITHAEGLIGAAQHGLMKSLDYDLYVRKRVEACDHIFEPWSQEPFMVDAHASRVDVVGMAAAAGMTIYIRDRLDLPHVSRRNDPEKSYLGQLGFDRSYPATMVWREPSSVEDSGTGCSASLRQASDYSQNLRQFLQVSSDATNPQISQQWASDAFAESYLLACCYPTCQDLVQTLLQAGANPMIRVTNDPSAERLRRPYSPPHSFWDQWLLFLHELRFQYMKVTQRSGGFLLRDTDRRFGLTKRYVLDTTKSLLVGGADVNQTMQSANSVDYKCYLKRRGLEDNGFDLILEATAMFTLEECFSKEPEFGEIVSAISSSTKRPTRWLLKITPPGRRIGNHIHYDQPNLSLSVEDCGALWPLIEKWESSGRANDLQTLGLTLECMWRDNNPETVFFEEVEDDASS